MQVTKLTIDSSKIPASLTDYPVFVDLSDMNAEFWSTTYSTTLTDGLVSYYKLDESSGNAVDLTGVNNFTNNGGSFVSGKINNGLDLERSSSNYFSSTLTPTAIRGTGDKTISVWCNPESFSAIGNVAITFGGAATNTALSVGFVNTGKPFANLSGGGGQVLGTAVSTGSWYLLTAIFKTSGIELYVNGSSVGTGAANSMNIASGSNNIFGNYQIYDTNWGYDGLIDEVGVWDRALTSAEVTELYNSGSGTQKVKSGGDIRVFKSDGTTELAREVVSCDTSTETGELHFKYTGTLSSTVDTEVQIHADGTSADYATTDTYGAENVWTGYQAVYHLKSLTADSTGNGYTLTNNNSVGNTSVKIGDGADFGTANTNKSLNRNDNIGIDGGNVSISVWARMNTEISTGTQRFFSQQSSTSKVAYHMGYEYNSGTRIVRFTRAKNFVGSDQFTSNLTMGTSSIYKIDLTYDSSTLRGYINGSSVGSVSSTGNGTTNGANRLSLGVSQDPAEGGFTSYSSIDADEYRITSATLSSDWITTEYNNQNSPSTFYTATSPQSNTGNFLMFM